MAQAPASHRTVTAAPEARHVDLDREAGDVLEDYFVVADDVAVTRVKALPLLTSIVWRVTAWAGASPPLNTARVIAPDSAVGSAPRPRRAAGTTETHSQTPQGPTPPRALVTVTVRFGTGKSR